MSDHIVPYACVFIDAQLHHFWEAGRRCIIQNDDRKKLTKKLEQYWTSASNTNHVLPSLSVRTAFDLYLRVKDFPPGSEIIMSAINIPDMSFILRHHKLKIVPWDVCILSMKPKIELLESLISDKTVAILLAHLYGRIYELDDIMAIALKHKLAVIEDCAECFDGNCVGDPRVDISLFSFGLIKASTAFGGSISKIRDEAIYKKMKEVHDTYPIQPHTVYLQKVLKYTLVWCMLNLPMVQQHGRRITNAVNIDHKKIVVNMMRGFPDQLITKMRHQPCTALLATMLDRFMTFDPSEITRTKLKGDYVSQRLPKHVTPVGLQADTVNYWLYPILVENPDHVLKILNAMGVDAYRGATQLSIVESDVHPPKPNVVFSTRWSPLAPSLRRTSTISSTRCICVAALN